MSKGVFLLPNLAPGGAQRAVLALASESAKSGIEIWVVLLENSVSIPVPIGLKLSALYPDGDLPHGLLAKKIAATKFSRFLREKVPGCKFVVSSLRLADEVLKESKLQNGTIKIHRLANTLSSELEVLFQEDPPRARSRLRAFKTLYSNSLVVCPSKGVAEDLVSRIGAPRAVHVIPNIIDVKKISRLSKLQAPLLQSIAKPFVVNASRFVPQKRHDLLFEAWRKNLDFPSLCLLTDPTRELLSLINDFNLNGRVFVVGHQENPYPFIRNASLLVLSSDHEGLPNVILDALACGVRVASTNCPSGPGEILGFDYPYLAKCGDSEDLARVIDLALQDSQSTHAPISLDAYKPQAVRKRWIDLLSGLSVCAES